MLDAFLDEAIQASSINTLQGRRKARQHRLLRADAPAALD
jgi:hypothetical protein